MLLAETVYKDDWELPGGVVEPGESPRAGAIREILEEIGLAATLGEPAIVDWMPAWLGWSDAVEFIFDCGVLPVEVASALSPYDSEIRALHWCQQSELAERVSELSARRIALVCEGFSGHTENGYPVSTTEP